MSIFKSKNINDYKRYRNLSIAAIVAGAGIGTASIGLADINEYRNPYRENSVIVEYVNTEGGLDYLLRGKDRWDLRNDVFERAEEELKENLSKLEKSKEVIGYKKYKTENYPYGNDVIIDSLFLSFGIIMLGMVGFTRSQCIIIRKSEEVIKN